jgi:endoribonuclease Dicer
MGILYRTRNRSEADVRIKHGCTSTLCWLLSVYAPFKMLEPVLMVIQPHDNETVPQVSYFMTVEQKQFVCEVILPGNSPLRSARGRSFGKKSIAKRSAAFEACILLRKGKHLDSNFLPTYHKQLPAMRNALLALNLKKTNAYDMRLKPDVWESNWGYVPERLYLTTIALATSEGLRRPHTPLAMLTRTRLPSIPPFLLHLDAGLTSDVVCVSLATCIEVDSPSLAKLTSFTSRIFQDVFAKEYEMDESKMSYWLAPLLVDCSISVEDRYPTKLVNWELLNFVQDHDQLEWTIDSPDASLADKFLVDRFDGGKRYFSVKVVPELKALDRVPSDAAPHRYMNNILDYTVSLYAKSRARATWRDDQPVILAEKVLHRRNWLDEITEKEKVMKYKSYVCPEPLRISAVSGTHPRSRWETDPCPSFPRV